MLIQPGRLISSLKKELFPKPVYTNESPVQQLDLQPSELNPLQGTVVFEFTDADVYNGISGSPVILSIVNSGAIGSERIFLQKRSSNGRRMRVVSTGNGTPNEVYDHFLNAFPNGKYKVAIGWNENNLKVWFNGVLFCEIAGNYDRPIGLDTLGVGRLAGGGSVLTSATIDKIEIYDALLTDAQAAKITLNHEMLSGVTFDEDQNIFMFMGQSNSVGQATGSPSYSNTAQMFLLGNDMVMGPYSDPYADPTNSLIIGINDSLFGIGYAGYFADHLSSLINKDVAVCPANLSSQGLAADTSSTWNARGNSNYRVSGTKITGINGVSMAAVNQLCMAQQFGAIRGIIWGQGESDAKRAVPQATYAAELQELIQAIRYAAGVKNLPWFNVGMPEWTTDIVDNEALYNAIIDAQRDVAVSTPYVYFVEGTGVAGGGISGDEKHYNLLGNETVGELVAQEVWIKTTDVERLNVSYAGQSLMQQQTTENGGDGDAAYKTQALNYFDLITTSQGASGGSGLFKSSNTGNYWINDDAGLVINGPAYNNWIARIDTDFESPEDVQVIHWNQGQTDGSVHDLSKNNYKTALLMLFSAMKAKCPNAIIIVDYLGVDTNELQAVTWQKIREVQLEVPDEVEYVQHGVWTVDQPLSDTVHFNAAGRILYGQRQADLAAYYLGKRDATGIFGPQIVGATAFKNTRNIKVSIDLDNGDTLLQDADNLRYKGWRVEINGIESTVYAAQKSAETEFNIAIADFINDGDDVRITWGYGPLNYPVPNQFPSNNSTDSKPLRPFSNQSVTVTDSPLSPEALGDVDAIWNAGTVLLDGSNRVQQFPDLSGNGFNFDQSDPTRRPEYHPNGGHNGLPIIQSNSVTDGTLRYLLSNYSAKAGMTVTFVANIANENADQFWGFDGNRAMVVGRALTPQRIDYKRRGADNKNITITNGLYTDTSKPVIVTLVVTGPSEMRIYENGALMIAGMPFNPEDEITFSNKNLYIGTSVSDSVFYFGDSHSRALTQDEVMKKHAYYKSLIGSL